MKAADLDTKEDLFQKIKDLETTLAYLESLPDLSLRTCHEMDQLAKRLGELKRKASATGLKKK